MCQKLASCLDESSIFECLFPMLHFIPLPWSHPITFTPLPAAARERGNSRIRIQNVTFSVESSTAQVSSIGRLLFNRPVDRSRSILTVDKDSPPGEYGRYRRSIRIHLRRIAVNVEKGLGLPISPFSCQSAFRRSRPQLKLGEEIDSSRLVDDYACKNQRYQTPPQG